MGVIGTAIVFCSIFFSYPLFFLWVYACVVQFKSQAPNEYKFKENWWFIFLRVFGEIAICSQIDSLFFLTKMLWRKEQESKILQGNGILKWIR